VLEGLGRVGGEWVGDVVGCGVRAVGGGSQEDVKAGGGGGRGATKNRCDVAVGWDVGEACPFDSWVMR